MRWNRPRLMLGLALGERTIDVAEVQGGADGARLLRHASFEIPTESGWDHPEKLGADLQVFLNSHGFTARHAVAGLPGRWLLSRPHAIPPMDEATARGVLRLAIERDFPGQGPELVFDAAGKPSADAGSTILLVATPRQRVNSVQTMLLHAGLEVEAISATALALASAPTASGDASDQDVLILTPDGTELAIVRQGRVCAIERLAAATNSMEALAGEVRRVQAGTGSFGESSSSRLTVWNDTGVTQSALKELGNVLGSTPNVNPELTGLSGADDAGPSAGIAAALALSAMPGRQLPVDFTDSRLADQPPPRITRPKLIAAVIAAVVVVGGLYLLGDWYAQHRAIESLTEQLSAMKADVAVAKTNVEHLRLVRGWYESRPPMLECMRALTLAFPNSGQVWTSSLSLQDDMTGTLVGKATDEKTVLDLMDHVKASGSFAAVKLQQLRQDTHGVSFAISFLFTAAE